MFKRVLAIMVAIQLGACASIVDGTTQEMTISTNPVAAQCSLERDNKVFVTVPNTPQTIVLKKTKHDITVTCEKPGYQQAIHFVKSEIQDATWGNIILGGGIGWAIDSASGADNKYAEYVNITLVPVQAETLQVQPAAPAVAAAANVGDDAAAGNQAEGAATGAVSGAEPGAALTSPADGSP